MKSTPQEIRERFDRDVERFSNLETGQSATIDAPLTLELIADAAAAICPQARAVLDVGCGAGNYSLKLLERIPDLDVTLIDLSRPMLDRAVQRVSAATRGNVAALQGDIREVALDEASFDVVMAAAVLHHLRADEEWETVFTKLYRCLRPGGSIWISDLVEHTFPAVQAMMWQRYGQYLSELKDQAYRDSVFQYVDREDTPRSVIFQIDLLRKVGFERIEILHKNSVFAAFGAVKHFNVAPPDSIDDGSESEQTHEIVAGGERENAATTTGPITCGCPACGELVPMPDSQLPLLQCPRCGEQFFVQTSPHADAQFAEQDDAETEQAMRQKQETELSGLRIQQVSSLRRGAYKARARLLIGAIACLAGAAQLVLIGVRDYRAGFRLGPIGEGLFVIVALMIYSYFVRRIKQLNVEIRQSRLQEPTTPPDLTVLSDGSQQWKALDELSKDPS